jgi:lipid-A-disaccharide synthase
VASFADASARARTIGIVAGETSGDLLGSQLIRALREHMPALRFVGIGGPRMEAAGLEAWYPLEKLGGARLFSKLLKLCLRYSVSGAGCGAAWSVSGPRLFIGVDAPDFNLSLEESLKRRGIPTVHYGAPPCGCGAASACTRSNAP